MWLADISIKRPVFATMMVMGFVALGLISYPDIGVDLFPRVEFPVVSVRTVLVGASPEVMDVDVTDKIEEALNTINGVKSLSSVSTEGASTVVVEFELERDIELAVQDVREKISGVRGGLPKDIIEPVIEKVDPDATPIMWIALYGDKSVRELSTYANETVKEQLQRIQGVGSISMGGMRLRQIRINVIAERLRAYGLTAHDVAAALQRQNVELPGGRVETGTKEYAVKIKGELADIREFNDLIVGYQGGTAVRIRDIGSAEDSMETKRSIIRFNGRPSVGLGIRKQSGTNTVEVIGRVKAELEKVRQNLPPGMMLEISFDQSIFITRSINEVQHHLLYGGLLASLSVLLFLKSFRITFISALAIPTSIVATFAVMKIADFSFNNMTMLALSLSIGILIDDAIIVIENIHRHIHEGMSPREAASQGTREIGLAVMATTLAIVVIFLPVAFMKGIIGRFFMSFALTVVFSVLISLFVSFTLTPMLASRMLSAEMGQSLGSKLRLAKWLDAAYEWVERFYSRVLHYALDHRAVVVAVALLSFLSSFAILKFVGTEFVPEEDQSQFVGRLEAPLDYSVDKVDEMFHQAEAMVAEEEGIRTVFYAQGFGGEVNKGFLFVSLKPKSERKRAQKDIMVALRKRFATVVGLRGTVENVSLIGGGMRNVPIQYVISGRALRELEVLSNKIVAEFSAIKGVVDVDTSVKAGKPEVQLFIDRQKAADLGMDVTRIVETINILVGGEAEITKYKDPGRGRRYDVRVRLAPEDRDETADLGRLTARSADGRLVSLDNVLRFEETGGPVSINRVDRQRAVFIFANLEGMPLGEATGKLNAIAARILPGEYTAQYKGSAEVMQESFKYLMIAIVLGVVLAYMVLASQFESFIHPLTVLLSLPLSFVGAFGALLITGMTLNIFSFIGLILLMGLVKKNAILLVDYTITLRARGMSRREALLKAGPVRLKPILMTTIAMIFGMMPVAIGLGEGSETRAPMAVVTIGGLVTSLLLTLVVIPVAYDLLDTLGERGMGLMKRMKGKA